jgi:hypothetical protein
MRKHAGRAKGRRGLDTTFEADEVLKSNLILEARLLREQQQDETAAHKFAQAALIEETLSDACEERGLHEKAFVHRFSAASCWAQAGNFSRVIELCGILLGRGDLPERLRQRVQEYAQTLRTRRSQWCAGLVLEMAKSDV